MPQEEWLKVLLPTRRIPSEAACIFDIFALSLICTRIVCLTSTLRDSPKMQGFSVEHNRFTPCQGWFWPNEKTSLRSYNKRSVCRGAELIRICSVANKRPFYTLLLSKLLSSKRLWFSSANPSRFKFMRSNTVPGLRRRRESGAPRRTDSPLKISVPATLYRKSRCSRAG